MGCSLVPQSENALGWEVGEGMIDEGVMLWPWEFNRC